MCDSIETVDLRGIERLTAACGMAHRSKHVSSLWTDAVHSTARRRQQLLIRASVMTVAA